MEIKASALLAQVLENPDDIDVRRVYADLLLENGEPRGEFIQLQCLESPNRKQRGRQNALLKEHRTLWLDVLAPVLKKKGMLFENGFLSHCVLDSAIASHTKPASLRNIKKATGHEYLATGGNPVRKRPSQ